MKFTQLPADAFKKLQINAGIICTNFDPLTGTVTANSILGATSGGIKITATPTFADMGDDVDNCPKNTKELKKTKSWDVKASGTFVTATTALVKSLIGAADVSSNKITPRLALDPTASTGDFEDLWFVGDYSDQNGTTNGGFIAVRIINALSTGGFQIQTADQEKGKFAFEYTGHTSLSSPKTVPFEAYVTAGTAEPTT